MESAIDVKMLLSGASFVFTAYFWFVKARRERPQLQFHQLSNFRATCRRHPRREGWKRLCLQQLEAGGVLIVNHSTRQNAIVIFDCYLETEQGERLGDWGYSGDDKPPWNIGPESSIAFSPACFFDVPEDFEVPDDPAFRIEFITASGKKFSHRFSQQAPRYGVQEPSMSRAA